MKAMILAAGLGKRMLPLTANKPKPLLKVGGKPLLEHHILNLKAAGFTELVINTAYLGEQIAAFCGDGSQWGLGITISSEDQPLETAGGIIRALPWLGKDPFLVVNGDIWCAYPFQKLVSLKPPASGAHLVLVPNPGHNRVGDFDLNQDRVAPCSAASLTFSGIAVYQPEFFQGLGSGKAPLKPLLDAAVAAGRVSGEQFAGQWVDVGTPERLAALESQLARQEVK